MRLDDSGYEDAHIIIQGHAVIAVNECCTVVGLSTDRRVDVSFFTHRWRQEDPDRARMHAEVLTERLKDLDRKPLTDKTLIEVCDVALSHYMMAEKQGWMVRVRPHWEHDCRDCIFLGPMNDDRHAREIVVASDRVDLYYCPNETPFPTVIARYGNDGPEYKSGIAFGMHGLDPELAEAWERVKMMRLDIGAKLPRLNAIHQGSGQPPAGRS